MKNIPAHHFVMILKRLAVVLPLAVMILPLTAGTVTAVPAAPLIHTLRQSDGGMVTAKRWGDENSSGWETEDGYTIVHDPVSNDWVFAWHDAAGKLSMSRERAGNGRVPEHGMKQIRPERTPGETAFRREIQRTPLTGAQFAPSGAGAPSQAPVAPLAVTTGNIPVILIKYQGSATTYAAADFTALLFGTGTWSMKDYYNEVSYGKFTVSPGPAGVVGWYTSSSNHDYYGTNISGSDQWPGDLVHEAVAAADATVNFSAYDMDGDCYVDAVNIVHQGTGEEASTNANDIWSHSWNLYSAHYFGDSHYGVYTTNDHCSANPSQYVKINDYVIQPEMYGSGISTVGVFAHEYAHALGLPDLYDTDYSSKGVGKWSLMAGGSWNSVSRGGDRPAHLDAWSRYALGWSAPVKVTSSQTDIELNAVETVDDCYQFRDGSPAGNGEYFLLENRRKTGFDAGLPGEGLLLWHVDEGVTTGNTSEWYPGCISCTSHYRVALIQADNLYRLEKNTDSGNSGDPFPGSTNNYFISSETYPANNLYSGAASEFSISDISSAGSVMYASFILPDTTPPVTTIDSTPPPLANSSSGSFSFLANESATFACRIDGAAFAPCTSQYSYNSLADGSHTFTVRATDLAENVEISPPAYTWSIDTIAPETTITGGPSSPTTAVSASFTFTSTETSATFECRLNIGSWGGCSSGVTYSNLVVGNHTFSVRAKDPSGNTDATPALSGWSINGSVKIGPSDYSSLSAALAAANSGETLKLLTSVVPQVVSYSGSGMITLEGGYDGVWNRQPDLFSPVGSLTIVSGALIVDQIAVQ